MSFSQKLMDDILLIEVNSSRATIEFSVEFKDELKRQIENGNVKIVVDLSKAEFMDSAFLGALVVGLKEARMRDGYVKLVGLRPEVYSMFELTKMDRIFSIYGSLEETLTNF